jgi:hypothetical protein
MVVARVRRDQRRLLDRLRTPAIESAYITEAGDGASARFIVKNHWSRDLPGAFAQFSMPYLSDGSYYTVKGGTVVQQRDSNPGRPGRRVLCARVDVPATSRREIAVHVNRRKDLTAPTGGVSIAGGGTAAGAGEVILNVEAVDEGGSGVKDMMISSEPEFRDCQWQPFTPVLKWSIPEGEEGPTGFYVKFRDFAMPPNVSDTYQTR